MSIKLQRVDAAAFQLCMAERINWGDIDKAQKYTFRADASAALTASDALLTNDAAIERVARALFAIENCDRRQMLDVESNWMCRLNDGNRDEYRTLARAAITALLVGDPPCP